MLPLLLTHDIESDPGLLRQRHVVVAGDTSVPRPHVATIQPLYRQRVLDSALLVGDVRLVDDAVVAEPENTGRGLASRGHALNGQRIALLKSELQQK